jgi:hypothetical protein
LSRAWAVIFVSAVDFLMQEVKEKISIENHLKRRLSLTWTVVVNPVPFA